MARCGRLMQTMKLPRPAILLSLAQADDEPASDTERVHAASTCKTKAGRAFLAFHRCGGGSGLKPAPRYSFSRALIATLFIVFAFVVRGENATNSFGFTGPEIFPIDEQINLLHAADLDGDGLNDLIVANNLRSKINLLYNQTGKTNRAAAAPARKLEINELPPDARFRIDSIPTDERMGALVVADLNGDGRPDLAFYGDAKDLEVIYNKGTNGWSEPKRWHIVDGQLNANALVEGDLNGDGRADLVLLGDNGSFYFLPQLPDHTLGEPQKIPCSGTPKSVQIVDVDGDGRNDLLLVDWDSPTPLRFRLQNAAGQLGPEIYFRAPPMRSFCMDNLEGDGKNYIVTIARDSGRAEVSQFTRQPAEILSGAFRRGQFQILPLNKTDAAQRGLLWADVNGDGRPDLLVAEPASGQLSVYLQSAGRFARPAPHLSHPGRGEPARGGGLERRRPAGCFSPEPGRKRRRRGAV